MADRKQTLNEEIANAVTHGMGVLFCAVAIPFMVALALKSPHPGTVWPVSVFCFGMATVYLSSTLYHAVQHHTTKKLLQVWDHISIFMLIAGTYTPVVVKFTDSNTSFVFLTVMWGLVFIGSILKLFYTGRFRVFSALMYVVMGWMAIFIFKPLMTNVPPDIFKWMVAGGIIYMIGVIFYLWNKPRYHHAVWHIFVLTGTVTHFFAVYNSIPINIKL